jgi:hypothetical protein
VPEKNAESASNAMTMTIRKPVGTSSKAGQPQWRPSSVSRTSLLPK